MIHNNDSSDNNDNYETIYEKYRLQELKYSKQLHAELKLLITRKEASKQELSKGLHISRSVFFAFINWNGEDTVTEDERLENKKRDSLSINRSNILNLHHYLTNEQRISQLKISEAAKQERKKLREKGPDELLRAAGFLPESESILLNIDKEKLKNISRIIYRLSSPVIDAKTIWEIEDMVLNNIRTKDIFKQNDQEDKGIHFQDSEKWFQENYPDVTSKYYLEKLQKCLRNFAESGKIRFTHNELFELYQAISENHVLRLDFKHIKLYIIDCEITTITSLFIEKFKKSNFGYIINEIEKDGKDYEEKIRGFNSLKQRLQEAKVTFCIKKGEEENTITWRYSSISTPIENLLKCLYYILGYPSVRLKDSSMRSLSFGSESLARISTSLEDKQEKNKDRYNGVWVDRNLLICLLQSITFAVEQWLFKKMNDIENFAKICDYNHKILEDLYSLRNASISYRSYQIDLKKSGKDTKQKLTKINDNIKKIREELKKESQTINNCYESRLQRYEYLTELMELRINHVQGNIEESSKKIKGLKKELENILEELTNTQDINDIDKQGRFIDIGISYAVENMIAIFVSGEKKFIQDRRWRSESDPKVSLNYYINKMNKIFTTINKEKSFYENRSFDFQLHNCISELFGMFARFDLYFSIYEHEKDSLELAIKLFHVASYFSSKIGNEKRVTYWLAQVSRVYSRLGDIENAQNYINLAEEIIKQANYEDYNEKYKYGIMADINVAYGELNLLKSIKSNVDQEFNESKIKDDNDLTIIRFVNSLEGGINFGYARAIVDSLYGIYRVAESDKNFKKDLKTFQTRLKNIQQLYIPEESSNNKQESTDIAKESSNNIQVPTDFDSGESIATDSSNNKQESNDFDLVKSIELYEFFETISTLNDWKDIAEAFKKQTQKVWNTWAKEGTGDDKAIHLISDYIDNGTFLSLLE